MLIFLIRGVGMGANPSDTPVAVASQLPLVGVGS